MEKKNKTLGTERCENIDTLYTNKKKYYSGIIDYSVHIVTDEEPEDSDRAKEDNSDMGNEYKD